MYSVYIRPGWPFFRESIEIVLRDFNIYLKLMTERKMILHTLDIIL